MLCIGLRRRGAKVRRGPRFARPSFPLRVFPLTMPHPSGPPGSDPGLSLHETTLAALGNAVHIVAMRAHRRTNGEINFA